MQAGRYAAGYPAETKTSNVQRWWRKDDGAKMLVRGCGRVLCWFAVRWDKQNRYFAEYGMKQ